MKKKNLSLVLGVMILIIACLNFNNSTKDFDDCNFGVLQVFNIAYAEIEAAKSKCLTTGDAFCKNDPPKNWGICMEEPTRICCKESSGTNKDCYDVGL